MPENSTTTPQSHKQPLLKKGPFRYFFWCWWFIWRKKKKLLVRVWMVYRALSLAWNLNLCACVYLREERALCQERPAFPASDALGWRGNRARKGECPVKLGLSRGTHSSDCSLFYPLTASCLVLSSVLLLGLSVVIWELIKQLGIEKCKKGKK